MTTNATLVKPQPPVPIPGFAQRTVNPKWTEIASVIQQAQETLLDDASCLDMKQALYSQVVRQIISISTNQIPIEIQAVLRLSPAFFSSFEYAFLKLGDFRLLLTTEDDPQKLPQLMEQRGYTFHATPKVGDLVLFLDDTGEKRHMGIVREGNLIESKWGRDINVAYLHQPEDVPETFGTKMIYCRPPENFEQLNHDVKERYRTRYGSTRENS